MTRAAWWRERHLLRRFVQDLLAHELVQWRRSDACVPPRPWSDAALLHADLRVDSLERLALATALAEAIHLHESGVEDALLARRTLGDWLDVAATGLAHFDAALTFRTSGSTGAPRRCSHPVASLLREVEALAALVGPRRRILFAIPSHHIYGFLFTVLLPVRLGVGEDGLVDLRDSSPATLASRVQPGDLVVAHPLWWSLASRHIAPPPADVQGVTSTAPCPEDVALTLEAAGLSLLQVYGASETGGIGWRRSARDPYTLFDHVAEDVAAPDILEWAAPRRFRVGHRVDGAVQVGGVNVFPAHVRDVLLEHPAVAEAAVRLMRPDEGVRLKAFVVPAPAAGRQLEDELRRWIAERLAAPQRPAALRFGAALPRAESGKLSDWSIDAA